MRRIRIKRTQIRARASEPLPLDPRNPDVVRAKTLAREREQTRKEHR